MAKAKKRSADGATRKVNGEAPTVLSFDKGRLGVATKYGIDAMLGRNTTQLHQYKLFIEACKNKEMTPKNAADVSEYMRAAVSAKRKASGNDTPLPKLSKQEITHDAAVLKLHTFACVDDLFKKLAPLDLSRPSIVAVARWIRDNDASSVTTKQVSAPPVAALLAVVNDAKATKQGKGKGAKRRKRSLAVGMPTSDPKRGALHIVTCGKAWLKANPEANASDRALIAGIIRNGEKLASEAAPRITAERVKKAAA
jgi:hypothetical protein